MTKGFNRIKDGLDDVALDIPNAEDKFKFYLEQARGRGRLMPSIGSFVANVTPIVAAST
ncbi:UNVERIFIED_CONTAM: ma3 domain-containing translation regulatory factor 3 [Sesamum radiatum]